MDKKAKDIATTSAAVAMISLLGAVAIAGVIALFFSAGLTTSKNQPGSLTPTPIALGGTPAPTGSISGSGCPNPSTNGTGQQCHYLNPSINIFDTSISQSAIDGYTSQYSPIFINAGIGTLQDFTNRLNYIISDSQKAGLSPALFMGYWDSESLFSTYIDSSDLGCAPGQVPGFYNQVDCATGLISGASLPSQCASSHNANSSACQELKSIRSQKLYNINGTLYSNDDLNPINYPITTFDDFAEAYGPKAADINNCTHTYGVILGVAEQVGACRVSSPTQPTSPTSNFVYYCQGNPAWSGECSLGSAGCGPTSVAMVLSSFGVNMTPPQVDQVYRDPSHMWRTCSDDNSFTQTALQSSWLSSLGFTVAKIEVANGILDANTAKNYLDNGYLLIGSSDKFPIVSLLPGTYPFQSHIFVVDQINLADDTVDIRDPNNCNYSDDGVEIQANRLRNLRSLCLVSNPNCGTPSNNWGYAYALKKIK